MVGGKAFTQSRTRCEVSEQLSHYIASLATTFALFSLPPLSYVQTYCLEYWGRQKGRMLASFQVELWLMQDYIRQSFSQPFSNEILPPGYLILAARGPCCPRTVFTVTCKELKILFGNMPKLWHKRNAFISDPGDFGPTQSLMDMHIRGSSHLKMSVPQSNVDIPPKHCCMLSYVLFIVCTVCQEICLLIRPLHALSS